MNAQRRAEWQIALWSIFLVCFVAAGALPLSGIRRQRQVGDQSPYNSIDAVFRDEFGFERGTQQLELALQDVPKNTPVTVVYPGSGSGELAGMITTQLLWPRPVREIRFLTPSGRDVDSNDIRRAGGVAILVAMYPREDLGQLTSLKPMFHIVRISPKQ